ncbi:hypothetical protein ATK36_3521 [Amycolatopsis sulphurea]|uniref:Uncharacterized protein n=1 Tax=Amycolatopsis sulphurea TaxID=76022 RepID=A0A2A9FBX6_9PSEU|nr:hypothetical protein ATK36_3521 [Amycolatopsis sulphurea]
MLIPVYTGCGNFQAEFSKLPDPTFGMDVITVNCAKPCNVNMATNFGVQDRKQLFIGLRPIQRIKILIWHPIRKPRFQLSLNIFS